MFRALIEERVSIEDVVTTYGEVVEHVLEVLLATEGKAVGDGIDAEDVSLVLLIEEGTVIKDDAGARAWATTWLVVEGGEVRVDVSHEGVDNLMVKHSNLRVGPGDSDVAMDRLVVKLGDVLGGGGLHGEGD
jgi:hypothetical protein